MAEEKHFRFLAHTECEFFPCHMGIASGEFNCLFCFCPLYPLQDCGGEVKYTSGGIKDCSDCLYPHKRENYDEIMDKCALLAEITRRK